VLQDEAALRAGRHDDDVLQALRLHQPRISVRKSSRRSDQRMPAARDRAGAQMRALHAREWTKISRQGRGAACRRPAALSSLKAM
jgi:hypothetical protein